MAHLRNNVHHVARQFDIDRPFVSSGGVEHSVDLAERGEGIVQFTTRNADLLEDADLDTE